MRLLNITNGIIDEIKFKENFYQKKILNLSDKSFTGIIEFESQELLEGYEKLGYHKAFDKYILADTQKIPVTEDYKNTYKYIVRVEDIEPNETQYILPSFAESDLLIREDKLENSKISLKIVDNEVYINGIKMSLIDFADLGDSYNSAPDKDDEGKEYKVLRTKIELNTPYRAALKIDFDYNWEVVPALFTLEQKSCSIKVEFNWENSKKNHILYTVFELDNPIEEVLSEDMNTLIKRTFDPNYNIREHLPKEKGIEVKNNTAPMQRGLLIDEEGNNIGIITKGLTQYEIYQNYLMIPILRSTGVISNPYNPARTTPAGPPLEVESLQMIGKNKAEMHVFFGNSNDFDETLNRVYNYIIC